MNLRNVTVVITFIVLFISLFLRTPDLPLHLLKSKYTNEHSKFMKIAGMDIHYRQEIPHTGDSTLKAPVVLLHGTSSSLHTWDGWTRVLLKHGYRVIRLDLPAFGLTGPNPFNNYTLTFYLDVLNTFLSKLNIPSCHIAGNSFGGFLAWNFAVHFPEKILSLTLLNSAGFSGKPPKILELAQLPVLGEVFPYVTPSWIIKQSVMEVYGDPRKVTQEVVERYYELGLREGNRHALIQRLRQTPPPPSLEEVTHQLSKITCPTLIMWGEKDTWIDVSNAHHFHKAILHSTLHIYDNIGHIPMEETPEETGLAFVEFLERKP